MIRQSFSVLLVILLLIAGCNSKTSPDVAIGEVNSQAIVKSEYDKIVKLQTVFYEGQNGVKLDPKKDQAILKDLQDTAFEQLVMDLVFKQEAEKSGIIVTDKEIEDGFNNVKVSVTEEGYQKMIKDTGLSDSDVKSMVRIEIISQKVQDGIAKNAKISDSQIKEYYQQHQEDYKIEAGMQIYHILVATENQALEVLEKINKGGDFAKLANDNSTDQVSRIEGGYVGIGNADINWVPEFKEAALKLKPGEIVTKPVKSQFGYHIIKAGKQVQAGLRSLTDMQEEVRNILKNQQANQAIKELRQKAEVKDLRSK